MKESYNFEPEESAFRAALVGNLKIDKSSFESKRLLAEWAQRGERLVKSGALDLFDWNKEEVRVYVEAGAVEAAVWVLKSALVEAVQQGRDDAVEDFFRLMQELGADPDDLGEVYG